MLKVDERYWRQTKISIPSPNCLHHSENTALIYYFSTNYDVEVKGICLVGVRNNTSLPLPVEGFWHFEPWSDDEDDVIARIPLSKLQYHRKRRRCDPRQQM
ncbi:hypothetical protein AVEN_96471-1 [Araneus ventricosus]|uniref:Uncharacterized protein n=1 Tax=Araneus ventricosus TaxID=182803 RepID=A0A4Y2CX20_ARAVE|nr:hypothetical protein AVEN_96471-1 [Araneus ventricosus]